MVLAPLVVHWGLIAITVLLDVPMDWSADLTRWIVGLILVPSFIMLYVLRKNPSVQERARNGPGDFLRYSVLILFAALASAAGGIALQLAGEVRAAYWVHILSLGTALLEIVALVGSILLETFRPTDRANKSSPTS
jgi:hypothetical protein